MSARAFSVIEFIVIIAVLGIVIAVGAPAFLRNAAVTDARTCQENLSRIQGAMEGYRLQQADTRAVATSIEDLVDTTGTGKLAALPHCPAGGKYTIAQGHASCSIGKNPNAPYAPHIYSTRLPYTPEKD